MDSSGFPAEMTCNNPNVRGILRGLAETEPPAKLKLRLLHTIGFGRMAVLLNRTGCSVIQLKLTGQSKGKVEVLNLATPDPNTYA